jgi:hypothetical protein
VKRIREKQGGEINQNDQTEQPSREYAAGQSGKRMIVSSEMRTVIEPLFEMPINERKREGISP